MIAYQQQFVSFPAIIYALVNAALLPNVKMCVPMKHTVLKTQGTFNAYSNALPKIFFKIMITFLSLVKDQTQLQ